MDDHLRTGLPEAGLGPDPGLVLELLVVRPGGLGDIVRAVPALRHLRETYRKARISVAADAPARDLLDACPYVHRVIALERPSEAPLERFDVALSFAHPESRCALEVDEVDAGFRARWSIDGDARSGGLLPAWPARLDDATRMLRLAWLLGGDLRGESSLALWPSLADRNGAARLVVGAARPIALLHVGAGDAARLWPADRWARVVDLVDAAGLEPVLVGTAADAATSAAVLAGSRRSARSLVGGTTVGELVGLLERAALFVGSDSGPASLAGALGVRSVVVGPASVLEHVARPGLVDLVPAGACDDCGELACMHPTSEARHVTLERVLGRVELAAATAVQRWNRAQIA